MQRWLELFWGSAPLFLHLGRQLQLLVACNVAASMLQALSYLFESQLKDGIYFPLRSIYLEKKKSVFSVGEKDKSIKSDCKDFIMQWKTVLLIATS